MARIIDTDHLGRDRVIGAWLHPGPSAAPLLVDPGPACCLDRLLAGLGDEVPAAILLTHIHLDHAAATGQLVRRWPDLTVYVHRVGAPHLIDPSRLWASASRLYGDQAEMLRLWGEVLPVPAERVVALDGGERVAGMDVLATPGHAWHHLAYLDPASGGAYVGDLAGVRIPPSDYTAMPTPPPEIEIDAWQESLRLLAARQPSCLRLTHFGAIDSAAAQLDLAAELLVKSVELARGGRERFLAATAAEFAALPADVVERQGQGASPQHRYAGIERWLQKRPKGRAEAAGQLP